MDQRQALLDEARGLRVPSVDELNKPLDGVKLESLRVSMDEKRTQKYVNEGLASRFQRRTHLPRKDGRKLPTVIQLHPDGAPGKAPGGNRRSTRSYRAPSAMRPSVEELTALLDRLAVVERELSAQKTKAITDRIAETKRRLIDLSGDEEANAISELHQLTEARRSMAESIRRDAFTRIGGDSEFGPRRWLALLSMDRSE